ncbi:type II toxin-antitoxin system RelE/ParE family toxin [Desulfovibrio sp. ZJ200]|uniref:type II toxin-antitoxin system RelE/ParE family toxin n=1 Tax=Desulfovibrio sp. ZJ200 TaxID=2709792 RepID=UPI001F152702|nr:type II toxin-antitoxin system RelE/ParE family toxin [Desulfovibrio sp. ZJ200]
MNIPPMTVVETVPFLRDAKGLLPDEERARLVLFLGTNPEAGDLIEDTGGVRKLRWARKGGGKSGGYRVLYYYYSERIPLFILGIYAKNAKETVEKAEKNTFKKLIALLRQSYGV